MTVPTDFRSGSYALMLEAGDAKENIPFFVVPPLGKSRAKIAVDHVDVHLRHLPEQLALRVAEWSRWRKARRARTEAWTGSVNPADYPEYGWSTYNYHTDRTGISFASWQRPMLNVRIGYITYPHEELRASGLRHYPADHHLLSWLEGKGYEFDVITDWELHHDGLER